MKFIQQNSHENEVTEEHPVTFLIILQCDFYSQNLFQ